MCVEHSAVDGAVKCAGDAHFRVAADIEQPQDVHACGEVAF